MSYYSETSNMSSKYCNCRRPSGIRNVPNTNLLNVFFVSSILTVYIPVFLHFMQKASVRSL